MSHDIKQAVKMIAYLVFFTIISVIIIALYNKGPQIMKNIGENQPQYHNLKIAD